MPAACCLSRSSRATARGHLSGLPLPSPHSRTATAVRVLLLGTALGLGAPGPQAWSQPVEAARKSFQVAAGPLEDALNSFTRQAGVTLSFDPALVRGKQAAALSGSHGVEAGLASLLARHGLEAVRSGDAAYVVRPLPAPAASGTVLPSVTVTASSPQAAAGNGPGAYAVRSSKGATGMGLSLRETPQSVSVVTRAQMDDFQLNSVNDVLAAAPGIVVEKVETERTYYSSRGFAITTFQDDGVGIPFTHGLMGGDPETAVYERIEVIRGANGLLSNTGNPSATVNFVRKRPTADFQASAQLGYGSWNSHRVEADIGGPLNAARTLRGRLVAVAQDGDSYLDRYSRAKNTWYGVLEADLGERTTVTLGHTEQESRARGQTWGGLPLYYSDGSLTHYDRSTSTTADWARWNIKTPTTFVEATHALDNGWEVKGSYSHRSIAWANRYIYVYGLPDPVTGQGLGGMPVDYNARERLDLVDLRASGPFVLGGRTHTLMLGASHSNSRAQGRTMTSPDVTVPALETWDGSTLAPVFATDSGSADFRDKLSSFYAAGRFNLADDLKLIVGANATHAASDGLNYGTPRDRSDTAVTPYVGVVYDLGAHLSAYGSVTRIFNPQSEIDTSLRKLAPVRGTSMELGLKAEWFDKRLTGAAGVFRSEQSNLAEYVGEVGLRSVYRGTQVRSHGVEFELAGEVARGLQLTAGYTWLAIEDADGNDARLQTPRQIARVGSSYRVVGLPGLQVGAALNWQSATQNQGSVLPVTIRQPSYALLSLMARYAINDKLALSVNVYNATDRSYLTSRRYLDSGIYGAPRSAVVALQWKY